MVGRHMCEFPDFHPDSVISLYKPDPGEYIWQTNFWFSFEPVFHSNNVSKRFVVRQWHVS
jgi:hypothetical protein